MPRQLVSESERIVGSKGGLAGRGVSSWPASYCAAYNLGVTTHEPKQAEKNVTHFLPPYAVILHNDDVNETGFVARALLKSVPELGQEDAVRIMLEAHNNGTAVVIVCPLERAELYRDRIRTFSLGCTIEKA